MAVVTWNGSSSTAYSTAANWDTGSVPADGDDVVIPDTSSINACNVGSNDACNSLTVLSNGEIGSNAGAQLAILGEADGTGVTTDGFAVNIDGAITDNGGTSLDLDIRTQAATKLDIMGSSGNIRNLRINHASCDAFLEANTTINGNLTISAGKLTCTTEAGDARTLNVAGTGTIGDGSSSADTATLTATSQDLLLGSGVTGTHSLVIQAGGTFVGGSGTHTFGSLNIKNSTAAKCTLSSGNTTINGEGSSNKAINIEGSNGTTNFAHGSGTVIITHDGASDIKADGVTLALNNLTINHASANINLKGNLSVAGDLTITAGELDTDSSNFALTVAGATHIQSGGTLTCNSSAVSLFSVTVESSGTLNATSGTTTITGGGSPNYLGVSIKNGATFNNNDGTFQIDSSSESWLHRNVDNLDLVFHHLIINGANVYIQKGDIHCEGNLTINASKALTPYNNHNNLTVDGDVIINGTLGKTQWGLDEPTRAACSFGSLTINSGGTYIATQNTTTITKTSATPGHSGLPSAIEVVSGGTFTHNSGTVLLSSGYDQDLEFDGTGNMYNLTINKSDNDVIHNSNLTIEGNLDITLGGAHTFRPNTGSRTVTVYGNTYLTSAGGGGIGNTTQYTGTNNWGFVTINSGEFILSTGTNNVSGIRNIGGTVSQS